MNFSRYEKMTQVYKEKMINLIRNSEVVNDIWVATEKVHGANFSFWYNLEDGIRHAKRSGFIEEGDNFFNYHLVQKYDKAVNQLYLNLRDKGVIQEQDTIVLFGELFGGNFFEEESNISSIQAGMNYHPSVEFVAFDVKVKPNNGSDSYFLPFSSLMSDLMPEEIKVVPIINQGSFGQVFETSPTFSSRIPSLFGLPEEEGRDSACEGLVLRPLNYSVGLGENKMRPLLKNKSESFFEVSKGNGKKNKRSVIGAEFSEKTEEIFLEVILYVNTNRLETVLSKEGTPCWKNFSKIVGLLTQDVLEDYQDDVSDRLSTIFKLRVELDEEWPEFQKRLSFHTSQVVRTYFTKVID